MREYGSILKFLLLIEIIRLNGVAGGKSVRQRRTKSSTLTTTSTSDVTLTQSDINAFNQLDTLSQQEIGTFSEQDLLGDLQTICRVVGGILPGDASCSCGVDLLSGIRITYKCEYQSPLCLFRFCSVPSINGSFAIGKIDIATEFCFLETEFRGNELPGLCITLSGEVVPDSNRTSATITTGSTNGSSSSSNNNNPTTDTNANARTPAQNDLHNVLAENRKRKHSLVKSLSEASVTEASVSDNDNNGSSTSSSSKNKIISCSARTYEDNGSSSSSISCDSCEICHSGTGIKFDCSNIYPGYVQSRCKNFPIFGRYTDLSLAKSQFLPVLDFAK